MAKPNQQVANRSTGSQAAGAPMDDMPEVDRALVRKMSSADILIPMARILQNNSPEVVERGASYVAGAKAGMIYIKNAPKQLYDGTEGLLFQPCYWQHVFVEWIPRNAGGGGGQGFVGTHPITWKGVTATPPADLNAAMKPSVENPQKLLWTMPNGNVVIETRYVGGYMLSDRAPPLPLILTFASSGHTAAKGWNLAISNKQFHGLSIEDFRMAFQITTDLRAKGTNTWFNYKIADPEGSYEGDPAAGISAGFWVSRAQYEMGKALYNSMNTGEVKADLSDAGTDEQPAATNDDTM